VVRVVSRVPNKHHAIAALDLDQTIAALRKVDAILATANHAIHRQRHANSLTA
jgi:hypothetical protein